MSGAGPRTGELNIRPLPDAPTTSDGRVDLDAIATALAQRPGDDGRPRILESVPGTPGTGRWSYVVAGVRGRLTFRPGTGAVGTGSLQAVTAEDPFAAIAHACEIAGVGPHGPSPDPDVPPFVGGLVGGFSYDLARAIERLPERATDDRSLPWLDLAHADLVVAVDHVRGRTVLVERRVQPRRPVPEVTEIRDRIAAATPVPPTPEHPASRPAQTTLPRDRYLQAVGAVLEHIAAGDTFQVNLSQRLTAPWDHDVASLYRALRAASPAPYGAVLPAGQAAVASISPETFLHVESGQATVRPIKGTRPRHPDGAEDLRLRDELSSSEKDRAENVMVVDMERNDLGRVCEPGSVEVPALCEVEAHPTVWHLVSTVTGRLRPEVGYAELLRATFPCGSVTGTPKVKAMELIDRYEPVRRGWYCGSLGFLSDGAASLSVAIRTAVLHRDRRADYSAGGGIVADSDPAMEHDESLDKAAAFLRAVGADTPRVR